MSNINDAPNGQPDPNDQEPAPPISSQLNPPHWSLSKLKMIPYEIHESERTPGVTMPGGYWVEKAFLERIFYTYWHYAKKLSPGSTYTAERLMRDPDWEDRERGEKLMIGRCFKYFAATGTLPIILLESKPGEALRYRLTSDGKSAVSEALNPPR